MALAVVLHVIGKACADDRGRRYTVVIFHGAGKIADTRRTSVSATDSEDHGVPGFLYLLP